MTPSGIDTPNSDINIASMAEKLAFDTNVLFEEIHIANEGTPHTRSFLSLLVKV
jgi:hypothetical protein